MPGMAARGGCDTMSTLSFIAAGKRLHPHGATDLCVGCGVCAGLCPAGNLIMGWTPEGRLQPYDQGKFLPKWHGFLEVCSLMNLCEIFQRTVASMPITYTMVGHEAIR